MKLDQKTKIDFLTDEPIIEPLLRKKGFTPLSNVSFYRELNSLIKNKKKNIYIFKRYTSKEVYDKIKKASKVKNIIFNHYVFSGYITDKINLLDTLTLKYIDQVSSGKRILPQFNSKEFPLPITFDLENPIEREAFEIYKELNPDTKWIFKPRNENCGQGVGLEQNIGGETSSLVQEYICNPLLYKGRKFDIRVFALMIGDPGSERGYIYPHFLYRTSSYKFDLEDPNPYVHITNNAIQKHGPDFGKYEEGNVLTDSEFDIGFDFLPEFKRIVKLVFDAMVKRCLRDIDPKGFAKKPRGLNSYEIFGFDFMITDDYKVRLIEVNETPAFRFPNRKGVAMVDDILDEVIDISLGKKERVFKKL